jgi:PIN domain nuclease of toxin-antitoxin system
VKVLVDTCTFLWWCLDSPELSAAARHPILAFDRLLTAQALYHGLVLVTPDPLIRAYPVRVEW